MKERFNEYVKENGTDALLYQFLDWVQEQDDTDRQRSTSELNSNLQYALLMYMEGTQRARGVLEPHETLDVMPVILR